MNAVSREWAGPLERIEECMWRIPKSYRPGMLVDAVVITDEEGLELSLIHIWPW